MATRVRITDVSPRDGLQNEKAIIPVADKVRLVELLCSTGVDEIEVTSFVSPKWVPQLGDASQVLRELSLRPSPEGRGRGRGSPRNSQGPIRKVPARNRLTLERARSLRRAMTGPEKALWEYLSGRQMDKFKFRRQHPFGPFILDFVCLSEGLVIEIDGKSHLHPGAVVHDEERTAYLSEHGLRVMRFSDDAVIRDAHGVAQTIVRELRQPKPSPQPPPSERGRATPQFSVLVPNQVGFQSLLDLNQLVGSRFVDKASVFTAASETFNQKNTNATIAESIARFAPVVSGAHIAGLRVRGYISCVIACPFEGVIAPSKVASVARQLADLGVDEIDLGDTIGAGDAATTRAMLDAVVGELGIAWLGDYVPDEPRLTLHLHDTFGRAVECVRAALDAGVRSFDGAVGGLGGCPYASTPQKRAPGNINTLALVQAVHEAGFTTGVNEEALIDAARFALKIVGRAAESAT